MMTKLRRFLPVVLGFSALGLLTLVFGCSGDSFSSGGSAATSKSCTMGGGLNTSYPTKILFMVDTSGSNVQMTTNGCGSGYCQDPPSDPNKSFRVGGIMSFFTQFQNYANLSWGLLTFGGDQSQNLTGGQSSIFTNSPSIMSNAINSLSGIQDFGDTPYQLAFNTAQQSIAADPAAAQSNYFLVLVTDGYPTDFYDSTGMNVNTQAVLGAVGTLVSNPAGHVTLSTLYYHNGSSDPTAAGLLQQMAQTGRGQFADVNTANNSLYPIAQLVPETCQ